MHSPQPGSPLHVLIIGAGFGGLGLAIQLQKAGISDFLIVEKASEVGGTWRDNQYPGAACDVPAHLYSFSFELKADWSRKFAPQAEIFAYLKHCADKYGLRPRIRFNSVVTADGRACAVDAIIYGTGFTATDFLAPMQIKGLGGRELNQAWRDGAEAYKGISVHGFPNLFMLYGPNTNLGHNSIVYMLESQFPYVLGCLQALREQGLRYLDVKPQLQQAYNQQVQQAVQAQGCTRWYKTATGKNTNNWPGFTFIYR